MPSTSPRGRLWTTTAAHLKIDGRTRVLAEMINSDELTSSTVTAIAYRSGPKDVVA